MLNIKTLEGLQHKLEHHKKSDWDAKGRLRVKPKLENEKQMILERIDLILKYQGKIEKWQTDIAEALLRLKKLGFIFLEEKTTAIPDKPPEPSKEKEVAYCECKEPKLQPDSRVCGECKKEIKKEEPKEERKSAVL